MLLPKDPKAIKAKERFGVSGWFSVYGRLPKNSICAWGKVRF